MTALGIVGASGSGKTTLIEAVLPLLIAHGLRVSTVKHAHHGFDMDRPGKDSYRHRQAGAHEVLVASGDRWALLHQGPEPPLADLIARLAPVDLVLVEGFKADGIPKLEIHRAAAATPPLWPTVAGIQALATDVPDPDCGLPVLPLNDIPAIARWMIVGYGLPAEGRARGG